MDIETRLAQYGNRMDPFTGAVSVPVYHATTFAHPGLGQSTGYDYTRTANPTRQALEDAIADLEGGARGFSFSSGMAAVHAVVSLLSQGDHIVASHDLYGGTYRLFERILPGLGLSCSYVDTGDAAALEDAVRPHTKALFIESPTNPTMRIADLPACIRIARERGLLSIVDNTFMTPYYQRPLALGADIVLHSATKYLGGHNDVLAGLIVARETAVAERIAFIQNSIGAVLGPQDAWLLMRGMKTLALRMRRHDENGRAVAEWLAGQTAVRAVYYPGLSDHPGRGQHERQASGYGGMVSFEVADERLVEPLLASVRLVTFAESLGGLETLITFPARQTHFDIPREVREAYGVNDRLLRLSVGIENAGDIVADLDRALAAAVAACGR